MEDGVGAHSNMLAIDRFMEEVHRHNDAVLSTMQNLDTNQDGLISIAELEAGTLLQPRHLSDLA